MESAERALVAAATRQEQLYSVVIERGRERLERVELTISEVGGDVGGASPNGGYVNREKQLGSLQVCDIHMYIHTHDMLTILMHTIDLSALM